MSQEELATRAGLSAEGVSLVERGLRIPRLATMRMLADAMLLGDADRAEMLAAPPDVSIGSTQPGIPSLQSLPNLPRLTSFPATSAPLNASDTAEVHTQGDPGGSGPGEFATELMPGVRLPVYGDELYGRDNDIRVIVEAFSQSSVRLVTVTGAGGVGKTRAAIAAATAAAACFPGGIRWLPLGSVHSPEALLPAIAGALGVRLIHGDRTLEVIAEHLADQDVLLVIDNADHLHDACRRLCAELLQRSTTARMLVTSRQTLGLPGELSHMLNPLELPGDNPSLEELSGAPASMLFMARARAQFEQLRISDAEVVAVARICSRLDGLPLAIELAAARTAVMTITELDEALRESIDVLRGPGIRPGQRLLDATVEWSYRLLSPAEQSLFIRLSVFGRHFSAEAAVRVCADQDSETGDKREADDAERQTLDLLSALVAKSLVVRRADAGKQARFALLQVIRDYGRARLAERGDEPVIRQRHARYYCDLAHQAEMHLNGNDQQHWLSILDTDVSNLRAAVMWTSSHDARLALDIVGSLWQWCYLRGRYTEGRAWAAAALEQSADVPAQFRAPVLAGAGMLAFLQCEYPLAQTLIGECRILYESVADLTGVAWSTSRLGAIARERGDYAEADALHRKALWIGREISDQHRIGTELNHLCFVAWLSGDLDQAAELADRALEAMMALDDHEGIAWALINTGAVVLHRRELPGAELLLRQGMAQSEQIGFREGVAWCLNLLGVSSRLGGDTEEALRLQQASLTAHRELGDRWRLSSVLDELAANELARGNLVAAAQELGRADRLRRETGTPIPFIERSMRETTVRQVRAGLGATYAAARVTGMTQMSGPSGSVR